MHTLRNIIMGATGLAAVVCPVGSFSETRTVIVPSAARPARAPDLPTGLTPDRARQLQELRQWLEKRRILRGQRELEVLGKRQLLTPLGQRYAPSSKESAATTPRLPLDLRVGTPTELDAIRKGTPLRFGP